MATRSGADCYDRRIEAARGYSCLIKRRQLPVYSPMSLSALLRSVPGRPQHGAAELRTRLMSEFETESVVLTDSGTSALAIALGAACGAGGLAALPAYACYDVATASDAADVRVVLYDIDPTTLAPDVGSLQRALGHAPKAIVVVHLYGVPVDADAISVAAPGTNPLVIEDAAQAHGAYVGGKRAGARGELAVLSFGRGKGVSGGGGGALFANTRNGAMLLQRCESVLGNTRRGWWQFINAAAQWLLGRPGTYGAVSSLPFLHLGETIYRPPASPGRIAGSSARLATEVWELARAEALMRAANAQRLLRAARASNAWRVIEHPPGASPGYLRLPLIPVQDREQVLSDEPRRLGVMPGYPLSLNRLHGFGERCLNSTEGFPGAELLANQLVTLPTHSRLTPRDLEDLEAWLRRPAPV